MNVNKINLNTNNNRYYYKNQNNTTNNQIGFTSNIPQSTIEKEINALNPSILRGINKLKNNIGEFQDICINALGTGLLAPVFINIIHYLRQIKIQELILLGDNQFQQL